MPLLTTIYCFMLALFAWMAAAAEWPTSRGAATCLGVLGLIAVLLGLSPLVYSWSPAG
jgi:hypothetical protein